AAGVRPQASSSRAVPLTVAAALPGTPGPGLRPLLHACRSARGHPRIQVTGVEIAMSKDPLSLRKIDHVRFFVGNARQSAYFYRNAFGFDVLAYAGLETGVRHEAGYVIRQGQITFVLTSPLTPDHPENRRLVQHGDGVMDIALEVDSVYNAYHAAIRRGAVPVAPPQTLEDEHGLYQCATIRAYGDTTHTF